MASVDIHTVGAGGGSIGWRDPGGSLRVGPQSAGAVPGPASYGIGGTKATVTDANVFLGRIGALGKSLSLDMDAARDAIGALAAELEMGPAETAGGIITVVEETMAGAIRRVSVEEGVDPRGAVLVAFGGAGGLHAASLAKRLNMAAAVVPRYAGVFSALGLLLSPPRVDVALSISGEDELTAALDAVMSTAGDDLEAAAGTRGTIATQVDVRYVGQSHELSIPYEPTAPVASIATAFHRLHRERNGFARPTDPVEIVTVRAVAQGQPALSWDDLPEPDFATGAVPASREITAADGSIHSAAVYQSGALGPGARIDGPAVIEDAEATTYLGPQDWATIASNGALVIEW
jgi:N-methylhydantoinase A